MVGSMVRVVSAAALLQADNRPPEAQVALATFGAPLRKLYRWAFPYYFRDKVLCDTPTAERRTWSSVATPTTRPTTSAV